MLSSRVSQITAYLAAVARGEAEKDDETLRQIQALVSGLKGHVGGGELEKEFMTVRDTKEFSHSKRSLGQN